MLSGSEFKEGRGTELFEFLELIKLAVLEVLFHCNIVLRIGTDIGCGATSGPHQ